MLATPSHGRFDAWVRAGALFLVLSWTAVAAGATRPAQPWTLLLPLEVMRERDGVSGLVYEARLRVDADGRVSVEGASEREVWFPSLIEVEVENIKFKKRRGASVVKLVVADRPRDDSFARAPFGTSVFLDFAGLSPDQARAALLGVAVPTSREAMLDSGALEPVYQQLADRAFAPELMGLSLAGRMGLLRAAHAAGARPEFEGSPFGTELYLGLALPDLALRAEGALPEERARYAFRREVLPALEVLVESLVTVEQLSGARVTMELVDDASEVRWFGGASERLDVYAPTAALQSFVAGDLSEQQLLDDCFFLLDGKTVTPRLD